MSGEDLCEHDMFVDILWKDKPLAIPLELVLPVKAVFVLVFRICAF